MKVTSEQFKAWCESGFKEFGGTRQDALKYGLSVGLRDYDVSVIRKIAGLASHAIQPFKVTEEMREDILRLRGEGKTIRAIAEIHPLSLSIIHKIVKKGENYGE